MDDRKAFAILGIEQQKDENAVRAAYHRKLPSVNPEDNPEGFKELREAYETALAYAARTQEEEKRTDDTPSGLFVQKADVLYRSLKGRQDAEAWKALFEEPVFLDLEEDENCREKLLSYLTDHYYLPTDVWRVIGRALRVAEEKQKLYEKFSKDFIDYVVRKTMQGEDFEFDQLQGPDDGDLDGWILLYSKAGQQESDQEYDAMAETIRLADQKGFSHPGLSMMEARMLSKTGDQPAGDDIVEALLQGPFSDRLNVRYQAAEYFWNTGRWERAAALYRPIFEENHRHYMACKRLGQWCLKQGAYEEAKKYVNGLLSYPLDDEGNALLEQVNRGLEDILRQRLEENPENVKTRMDLGWCYLQDEKPQDVIRLMEGITPSADQEKDFVNLMCKVYYYAKQYEKAQPLVRRWLALLEEHLPKEGQARQEDRERMATGHSMLSEMEQIRAGELNGAERDAAFEQALAQLDLAKEASHSQAQDFSRCQIYLDWEKYSECEALCDELRISYPDSDWPIVFHQKACAAQYDAAGVVGDYYALRQMHPDYAGSWELAAEVFYQLRRTEDLDQLLEEAEKQNLSTGRLKKYAFYRKADLAEKKQELRDALKEAEQIRNTWDEEEWKPEEKAELTAELARNYWRLGEYDPAIALIDDAISRESTNTTHRYVKAGILKDQKKPDEALKLYLECAPDYDETPHFYANVGECYYRLGQGKEALPYLKEAVARKEDNPLCCCWIVRILKDKMKRADCLDQMEEALHYADLMVSCRPEAFFYIERGQLYMLAQEYDRAAEDFKRAVEADDTDPYAYSNLSQAYQALDRFEEAKAQAKRAVELQDNSPGVYHFEMLAIVCRQTCAYQEALDAYLEIWNRFPDYRESILDDILNQYCKLDKWQDALRFMTGYYDSRQEKDGGQKERGRRTMEIYCMAGLYPQALLYLNTHGEAMGYGQARMAEERAKILWHQGELDQAEKQIRRALQKQSPEEFAFPRMCLLAGHIFFFNGKRDEAAHWAREGLAYYQKHGGFSRWLNRLDQNLILVFEMGTLKLYAGEVETALTIAKELQSRPRCLNCRHGICTDGFELEASVAVAKGEYEQAIRLYEKILKVNRQDQDVRMKISLLKKRIGR